MPEMIIPGTYIEVRAEKLIVPGPIAIGNIGIVGTARRGKLNTVYTPANIGQARDFFGQADAFANPDEPTARELTLIRALELAYANGAQRIFAVRVAAAAAVAADYLLPATTGNLRFESVAPGLGYNGATITTGPASAGPDPTTTVSIELDGIVESWREVPLAVDQFLQVLNGDHPSYNYQVNASSGGGSALFTVLLNGASGTVQPDQEINTTNTAGTSGAGANPNDYAAGLAALLNENVHIMILAGQDAGTVETQLVGHLVQASSDLMRRERIGVIGSTASRTVQNLQDNLIAQDEGRVIFVGPGVKATDPVSGREVTLPGTYAAAAVAGRISALDPHVSPTNKIVTAGGLESKFNGTEIEQLLLANVLVLEDRNGAVRIVRGITSSSNTAWAQITTRRIVDYAKFGVRAAASSFIGKLNNERVRQALKGSINSFLADMVDREMLISYELDVSATREQQIRGIAQVTMVVRPTFSIDYIRVVMYLE